MAVLIDVPLEQLVRDELRGPVSELVRRLVVELVREQLNGDAPTAELVAEQTNGNGQPAAVDPEEPAAAAKLCSVCNERPAAKYRAVCEPCRSHARARAKREAAAALLEPDAEPRPATAKRQKNRGGKLLGAAEVADRAVRRVLIKSAPTEEIVDGDGRVWRLRRLPSLASSGPNPQPVATHRPRPSFRIA